MDDASDLQDDRSGDEHFGHFPWADRPTALQVPPGADDNSSMTQRTDLMLARQATTSRPSARLTELHRKAGEAAILRDGRLEIAIDECGALSARVVSTER